MYTNKELLIFAEILKRNCQAHVCANCPFRREIEGNDSYDCKINSPYDWELDKS